MAWQKRTAVGIVLGATEGPIIEPFEFDTDIVADIVLGVQEQNGFAARVLIYGSMGDPRSPNSVPSFNSSGNFWSVLNSNAEGAVSASGSKLLYTARKPRYITIRGLRTGASDAKVDVVVGWRST